MLRKSKMEERRAVCRGPCFPANRIGGTQDVGDRSSSRLPRSVQFRGQKYILFFVISKEDGYGLRRYWRAWADGCRSGNQVVYVFQE